MLRTFAKGMSVGLVALLLVLPLVALGEEAFVITNAPTAGSTAWGDPISVDAVMTDEEGNETTGTLTLSADDMEGIVVTGDAELSYEYGATNMPANILYHALVNLNEGAMIRVEGDALDHEVVDPGVYTVTYTVQGAEGEDEALVCTVRVRGAIAANATISDYSVPLSDGKTEVAPKATAVVEEPAEEEDVEIPEPVPEVVVNGK